MVFYVFTRNISAGAGGIESFDYADTFLDAEYVYLRSLYFFIITLFFDRCILCVQSFPSSAAITFSASSTGTGTGNNAPTLPSPAPDDEVKSKNAPGPGRKRKSAGSSASAAASSGGGKGKGDEQRTEAITQVPVPPLLSPPPPYRLQISRTVNDAVTDTVNDAIVVEHYDDVNLGPFPEDIPPRNRVRFTPAQVEAIRSGMNKVIYCIALHYNVM